LGQLQGLFRQVAAMGGVTGRAGEAASIDLLAELYSWATTFTLQRDEIDWIIAALQLRITRMSELAVALCRAIDRMIALHLSLPDQEDLVEQMSSLGLEEKEERESPPTLASAVARAFLSTSSPAAASAWSSPSSTSASSSSSSSLSSLPAASASVRCEDFQLARLVMYSSYLCQHGPTLAVSDILREELEPYVLEFTGNVKGRMLPFLHATLVYTFTHQATGAQVDVAMDRVRAGRRMRYGLPGEALGQLRLRSPAVEDYVWEQADASAVHYTLAQLIADAHRIDGSLYHLLDSTCWHFVAICISRVFPAWNYTQLPKYQHYGR
jgi:hypothetical protein